METTTIDMAQVEAFAMRAIGDATAGYTGVMVSLGHKLGLYKAMAALLWAQMPTRLWGVGSMAVSAAASARTWAARASKRMGPSGASMAVRSGQRCAARQKKSIGYMG